MRIDVTTTTNTNSEDRDYKNLSWDYDDAIHANFFYFAKKVCLIFCQNEIDDDIRMEWVENRIFESCEI